MKYKVVSHSQRAHNILFNGSLMWHESFLVIGDMLVAKHICATLNTALENAEALKPSNKCSNNEMQDYLKLLSINPQPKDPL